MLILIVLCGAPHPDVIVLPVDGDVYSVFTLALRHLFDNCLPSTNLAVFIDITPATWAIDILMSNSRYFKIHYCSAINDTKSRLLIIFKEIVQNMRIPLKYKTT